MSEKSSWDDWVSSFEPRHDLHDDTFDLGRMERRATLEILSLFLPLLREKGKHVDPNDGYNVQAEELRVRSILRDLMRGVGRSIMDQPFEVTDKALQAEGVADKIAEHFWLDRSDVFDVITGEDKQDDVVDD